MKKILLSYALILTAFCTIAKPDYSVEWHTPISNDLIEFKIDLGDIKDLTKIEIEKSINQLLGDNLIEKDNKTNCKITVNSFYYKGKLKHGLSFIIVGTSEELKAKGANKIAIELHTQFKKMAEDAL